jgi:hypothetical protein
MKVYKDTIIENSAVALLSRVRNDDGDVIVAADVESISVKVWDKLEGTLVSTTAVDPLEAVYDTLQTGPRWTEDDDGYNVEIKLAGSNFPDGDRTYRVEALFTPTLGSAFYVLWDLACIAVLSE